MFKMKRSIFICIILSMAGTVSAQQKSLSGPWQFHSINNAGLLEGQTGSSFQLQTINGAQYKSWFAGIGLGLDFYRYRTIPLFIDIRREFGRSSNKLIVYADMGINFCWLTDVEKTSYLPGDKFNKGLYADMGLGYKIGLGKTNNLLLSIGYSLKKLKETYYTPDYYYPPDYPQEKEQINYSLNRLSIKIGWEF
jgi:hypothetical protein